MLTRLNFAVVPMRSQLSALGALCMVSGMICLVGLTAAGQTNQQTAVLDIFLTQEPIKPIPLAIDQDARKVTLGRELFGDARLSADNTVSCVSCHSLSKGGTDRRTTSVGIGGVEGAINAPTVFNSGFNFKQFWDGRAGTLEQQIDGPMQAPGEMASHWPDVLRKITAVPAYSAAFRQIYPGGLSENNVKDAIAEFVRSLYTPNSRFDQYLRGNRSILNADEVEGYRKFRSLGCTSCHQGVNVGGNMFERMGTMRDFFTDRGNVTKSDLGRFNVTGKQDDMYVFKVPSLRNVALTDPYFHDGSAKTLEQAVAVMARYQLGRTLTAKEIHEIVSFLNCLTGEYLGKPL